MLYDCILNLKGTWSYLAALIPTALAAIVFAVLTWRTRAWRDGLGAVWWLIPLEAVRNAAVSYDNVYWLYVRTSVACGNLARNHVLTIDNEIKVTIGLVSLISIWIYARIRQGGK